MDKSQYKDVCVFVEQREGIIQKVALELLGKARELADTLNEKVIALLLGYDMKDQAQELIAYGADIVVCVDERELAEYNTEPYAQAVSQFIRERHPAIVLIGATTIGRDLGPRLSARLTTGLTADCTGLDISPENDLLMTRPAFGGNLMATIICKEHRPQMATVRPGVMRTKPKDPARRGTIENMKVSFDPSKFRVKILKTVKEQKTRIDITEAKVLVSGGRRQYGWFCHAGSFSGNIECRSIFIAGNGRCRGYAPRTPSGANRKDGPAGSVFCPGDFRGYSAPCRYGRIRIHHCYQ